MAGKDAHKADDARELCILSIDGGGIRGLSSLYLIKDLMHRVNTRRKANGLPDVKPCQIFDLIGGTNTGGLIAIMLGRLEMSVDDCIEAYERVCQELFTREHFALSLSLSTKKMSGRFDSTRLDEVVENHVLARILEDATDMDLFSSVEGDTEYSRCKIFVCAIAHGHPDAVALLRSYSTAERSHCEKITIQEAIRATFATTPFFQPIFIAGRKYGDGAFFVNNPVRQIWKEAKEIWCIDDNDLYGKIRCFVSVGAGIGSGSGPSSRTAPSEASNSSTAWANDIPPPYSLITPNSEAYTQPDNGHESDLLEPERIIWMPQPELKAIENEAWISASKTLREIARETLRTSEDFLQFHNQVVGESRIFRFDINKGLRDVGLEEYTERHKIMRATADCSRAQSKAIQLCAEQLSMRQPNLVSMLKPPSRATARSINVHPGEDASDNESKGYGSSITDVETVGTQAIPDDLGAPLYPDMNTAGLRVSQLSSRSQEFESVIAVTQRQTWQFNLLKAMALVGVVLGIFWHPVFTEWNFYQPINENAHLEQLDKSLPIFAVLGKTGVGKSSFISVLGGINVNTSEPPSIGHGLASCTNKTEFFKVDLPEGLPHRQAYLVDTQGIDDSDIARNDTQIMYDVFNQLNVLHNGDKLLMGLIFLYDISQPRIGGSIINSLNMIEHLCGKDGISKVALVTTRWEERPDISIHAAQKQREKELREIYWKGPLDCGSSIVPYYGTRQSALNILSHLSNQRRLILPAESGASCRLFEPEPQLNLEQAPPDAPAPSAASDANTLLQHCTAAMLILFKCLYILALQLGFRILLYGSNMCIDRRNTPDYDAVTFSLTAGLEILATFLLWPGWLGLGTHCPTSDQSTCTLVSSTSELAILWFSRLAPFLSLVMAVNPPSGLRAAKLRSFRCTLGILDVFQTICLWVPRWGNGWWHLFHPSSDMVHFGVLIFLGMLACLLGATVKEAATSSTVYDSRSGVLSYCSCFVMMFTFWALHYYTPRVNDPDFHTTSAFATSVVACLALSAVVKILGKDGVSSPRKNRA